MNRILFKRFLVFLTVILTVAVMTFAFTACSFATTDGGKDNTSIVTDDDKDNTGEVTDDGNGDVDAGGNEGGNDEGGADGDETTPDEPENPIDPDDPENPIDPDDPENPIDPDDPEKPIDPEDPEQPVDPDDPENPVDPENPDENEPQDITEVDEIDEINKFGDEAIKILNNKYLDGIALKLIGKGSTAEDIESAEWLITKSNGNTIKELQVKAYYYSGNTKLFKVGKVTLNQDYRVSEILNGKATNVSYSTAYAGPLASEKQISENKELGNLVINIVNNAEDTKTQNEGDIWCSIDSIVDPLNGKQYRTITVYQIIENCVYKYKLKAEAPTVDVDQIMQNIKDGKTIGTPTCTTEYTFEGQKIEQETSNNALNAQYNSYSLFNDFDDEYVFE